MSRTASLPIFLENAATGRLQDQIYRCIRQCIVEGLVGADRRLPSTRALAADLGVSRTTALLALEQLRAEGYVVARRGSGMFIAPQLARTPAAPVATLREPRARDRRSRGAAHMLARMRAPDRRQAVVGGMRVPARNTGARPVPASHLVADHARDACAH